eukprot:TRINITY_DN10202_c0_g2_i1.p1 TRINITY_DN10202_c0_g2~~TRINITY_DN10202_c0_g2_i1.p1  ORF type:complete len:369 (+),score=61.49 TRINITY_DN10202_c0_g2_i1:72-1109(+)
MSTQNWYPDADKVRGSVRRSSSGSDEDSDPPSRHMSKVRDSLELADSKLGYRDSRSKLQEEDFAEASTESDADTEIWSNSESQWMKVSESGKKYPRQHQSRDDGRKASDIGRASFNGRGDEGNVRRASNSGGASFRSRDNEADERRASNGGRASFRNNVNNDEGDVRRTSSSGGRASFRDDGGDVRRASNASNGWRAGDWPTISSFGRGSPDDDFPIPFRFRDDEVEPRRASNRGSACTSKIPCQKRPHFITVYVDCDDAAALKAFIWDFSKSDVGVRLKGLGEGAPEKIRDKNLLPGDELCSIDGEDVTGYDREMIEAVWSACVLAGAGESSMRLTFIADNNQR